MITTSWRIDLWHKRDQLWTGPSTTPAMADTTARRLYAGKMKSETVKQTTREELGAHPEHAGAENKTGGATKTRVDGHSGHGGVSNSDGGAPVAALDKMINQQGIKHHSIKAKLEQHRARTVTHRGALATVRRTRRRRCRPRGRKTPSDTSRRSQTARMGQLGAQGTSGAMASLAEDGNARRRRHSSTEQRRR